MKDFFKPEDFLSKNFIQEYLGGSIYNKSVLCRDAANMANAKLEAEIEKWPKVFVTHEESKSKGAYWSAYSCHGTIHTHTARLAFIEGILKKECEHELALVIGEEDITLVLGKHRKRILQKLNQEFRCAKCEVELKWEAVK